MTRLKKTTTIQEAKNHSDAVCKKMEKEGAKRSRKDEWIRLCNERIFDLN